MQKTAKFLESINRGKKIRILLRKDPDMERASVQLVWSDRGVRHRVSPGLFLDVDPVKPEKDDVLQTAMQLRDSKEIELREGSLGIILGKDRRSLAERRDLYSLMEAWGETYYTLKNTRYSFTTALGKFKAFLGEHPPLLEDIRKAHLMGFRKYLVQNECPTYGHLILSRVKRFFAWQAEQDIIAVDPGYKVNIQRPDMIIEALDEEQVEKIFRVKVEQVRVWARTGIYVGDKKGGGYLRSVATSDFEDVRNAFILNTLCGLRIGDLMRLTGAKLPEEDKAFPWVASKTRKAYVIAPNRTGWAILRAQQKKYGDSVLFPLPRPTDRTRILRGIGNVCEIPNSLMMFRIARHTFGTLLYSRSADIMSTSKMMGHRKVETTQRHYARYDTTLADKAALALPEYGLVSKNRVAGKKIAG